MANKIVIDPITRIEGHMRVEATVENGVITDARSVVLSSGDLNRSC